MIHVCLASFSYCFPLSRFMASLIFFFIILTLLLSIFGFRFFLPSIFLGFFLSYCFDFDCSIISFSSSFSFSRFFLPLSRFILFDLVWVTCIASDISRFSFTFVLSFFFVLLSLHLLFLSHTSCKYKKKFILVHRSFLRIACKVQ